MCNPNTFNLKIQKNLWLLEKPFKYRDNFQSIHFMGFSQLLPFIYQVLCLPFFFQLFYKTVLFCNVLQGVLVLIRASLNLYQYFASESSKVRKGESLQAGVNAGIHIGSLPYASGSHDPFADPLLSTVPGVVPEHFQIWPLKINR